MYSALPLLSNIDATAPRAIHASPDAVPNAYAATATAPPLPSRVLQIARVQATGSGVQIQDIGEADHTGETADAGERGGADGGGRAQGEDGRVGEWHVEIRGVRDCGG